MSDMNQLMQQAKQMQEQMQKAQEEAANRVVVGESGAGLVKVHMSGRHEARKVEVDDDVMSEDREVLEDLLAAAINDATKKLEEQNRDVMSQFTSGLNLPEGFKMPF